MKKKATKTRELHKDSEKRLYVVYMNDSYYDDVPNIQVYGQCERFDTEEDAHAYAKSLMEEDTGITGGYEVYDTVVLDFPFGILLQSIPDMVIRVWYGEARFIPITRDDLDAFRKGLITLNSFIKQPLPRLGQGFEISYVQNDLECKGYIVARNMDSARELFADRHGIAIENILDCMPVNK